MRIGMAKTMFKLFKILDFNNTVENSIKGSGSIMNDHPPLAGLKKVIRNRPRI